MPRIALIVLFIAASGVVSGLAWWHMRRFAARYPLLTAEHGVPALSRMILRQMWLSVGLIALLLCLLCAMFLLPGGTFVAPLFMLYALVVAPWIPFLFRAQRAVRALPCESNAVADRRDAMVAIWLGSFWPPRDLNAAVDDLAVAPPAAAHTPTVARIAGLTAIIFVAMGYFQRQQPGLGAAPPFGFVIAQAGILATVAIVLLGVLTRRGSVAGTWALLAVLVGDRVGWAAMGLPTGPAWMGGALFVTGFYAWAAISTTKAHRDGAAAAGTVFD